MAVELGGISLTNLTEVSVSEAARIVVHPVPGLSGDLSQIQGRSSVAVALRGIFYGDEAGADLDQLRTAYLERQPVDFFTEAVGEGYFSQVLISRLEVQQRAGFVDQLDFRCDVLEYVEPPEPSVADPFAALNTELIDEAGAFLDDVQGALETVSGLTDLIANFPSFGDPSTQLPQMVGDYGTAVGDGVSVLTGIKDLF